MSQSNLPPAWVFAIFFSLKIRKSWKFDFLRLFQHCYLINGHDSPWFEHWHSVPLPNEKAFQGKKQNQNLPIRYWHLTSCISISCLLSPSLWTFFRLLRFRQDSLQQMSILDPWSFTAKKQPCAVSHFAPRKYFGVFYDVKRKIEHTLGKIALQQRLKPMPKKKPSVTGHKIWPRKMKQLWRNLTKKISAISFHHYL